MNHGKVLCWESRCRPGDAAKSYVDQGVAAEFPASSSDAYRPPATSASLRATSATSLPGRDGQVRERSRWADLYDDVQSDGEDSLPAMSVSSLPAHDDVNGQLTPTSSDDQSGLSTSSPSVGSMQHASGNCHPCIFFPKAQGCNYGWHCTFCHFDHDPAARHRRHLRRPIRGRQHRKSESTSGTENSTTTASESGTVSGHCAFLLPTALVHHVPQFCTQDQSAVHADRIQVSDDSDPTPVDSITSILTSVVAPWFHSSGRDAEMADDAQRGSGRGLHWNSGLGNDRSTASSEGMHPMGQRGPDGKRLDRSFADGSMLPMSQQGPGSTRLDRSVAEERKITRRQKIQNR